VESELDSAELTDTLKGLRVLIAEDNAVNQRVALYQLSKLGCLAECDGAEALIAIKRVPYDVILMDCLMSEMDGFEATIRLRKLDGPMSQVPVIAMTANAMVGDREACLQAGMNDYISKPDCLRSLATKLAYWAPLNREGRALEGE
jgi:CheY-like chemotaxis protein